MEDRAEQTEEQSFSELTVELVEQTARLAGDRLSAPIRTAGAQFLRLLVLAGAALLTLAAGITFLGVAIGQAVGLASAEQRWWIYLLVAVCFLVTAAVLARLSISTRKPEAKADGDTEAQ